MITNIKNVTPLAPWRKPLFTAISIVALSCLPRAIVHAESSDYANDIQRALLTAKQSPMRDVASAISVQDFKSSWDEFGINVLVDGVLPSEEVQKHLTEDIAKDIAIQLSYNKREEQYLQSEKTTPEEIQKAEDESGNDELPENAIDPHPSLDANPEVNLSATDLSEASSNALSDGSEAATSSPESVNATELDAPGLPPKNDPGASSDSSTQTETSWGPTETTILEAIINKDVFDTINTVPNSDTNTPPPPPPEDTTTIQP